MTASAFDPLSAADNLRDSGLGDVPARAIVDSTRDAQATGLEHLATKADLTATAREPEALIVGVGVRSKLGAIRWVVGIQSALTLATFAIVAAKLP